MQQFIMEVVLAQLRQVNKEITEQYYHEVRTKLQWRAPTNAPDLAGYPDTTTQAQISGA
jgi:hypothetical protein